MSKYQKGMPRTGGEQEGKKTVKTGLDVTATAVKAEAVQQGIGQAAKKMPKPGF